MSSLSSRISALCLATIAGAASGQELVVSTLQMSRTAVAGRAYYDLSTRTWSFDPPRESASGQFSVFDNDGTLNVLGGVFPIDDPTRTQTSIAKFGTELVSWGDIEFNSTIDQISLPIATGLPSTGVPVPGFDLVLTFREKDAGACDADATVVREIVVHDLPSGSWEVVVNLGHAEAFELGDTDGVDYFGNPASGIAIDKDEDGKADFSWGVSFRQNQATKTRTGVFVCFGGNYGGYHDRDGDGVITKLGGEDFPLNSAGTSSHYMAWRNLSAATPCSVTRAPGSPPAGSSANIQLRGPVPGDSALDLNGDGAFDSGDFFNFLTRVERAGS